MSIREITREFADLADLFISLLVNLVVPVVVGFVQTVKTFT